MAEARLAVPAADDDPRAFRMADADGKPIVVFADADGNAWLDVGGELARLDQHQAHKLGARIMGAGHRADSMRAREPFRRNPVKRPAAPEG